MKVSSILATRKTPVFTARPEESVREAIATLVLRQIGSLLVMDSEDRIVGIITERDMVRAVAADEQCFDRPVSEIMTRELILGTSRDDVMAVANIMLERRFRHLPIVEGDRLIGLISIGDVLKAQRDAYAGEIDTLETQLMAEGED